PIELSGADVDHVYSRRPALEEAVGEAARRSPDVEADSPRYRNPEMVDRRFELQPAAADVARRGEHFERGVDGNALARLDRLLAVDQHLAGEHQGLGFLPRFGQSFFGEQEI